MQEVREQELQLLFGEEEVKPLSLLNAKAEKSFSTFRLWHLGQEMAIPFFNTNFSNLFPHERQLYSNIGIVSWALSFKGVKKSSSFSPLHLFARIFQELVPYPVNLDLDTFQQLLIFGSEQMLKPPLVF